MMLEPTIEQMRVLVEERGYDPIDCILSIIESRIIAGYSLVDNAKMLSVAEGIMCGLMMTVHNPVLAGAVLEHLTTINPTTTKIARTYIEHAGEVYNALL